MDESKAQPSSQPPIAPVQVAVAKLEKQIGIPSGFLASLMNAPSDWAFIVQSSAFMEAAVSHLIMEVLGRRELDEILAHLDMSATKTGKVTVARAVGALDDVEVRFLRSLAELRNELVHDVRKVTYSLVDAVNSMDHKALKNFATKYNAFNTDPTAHAFVLAQFRTKPRQAMWDSVMTVAGVIYARIGLARAKRAHDDAAIATAKALAETGETLSRSFGLSLAASAAIAHELSQASASAEDADQDQSTDDDDQEE